MKKVFEVNITLVVDTTYRRKLIAKARKGFTRVSGVAWELEGDKVGRAIPAKEFIVDIRGALEEIVLDHPDFEEEKGIVPHFVACTCDEDAQDFVMSEDQQRIQLIGATAPPIPVAKKRRK